VTRRVLQIIGARESLSRLFVPPASNFLPVDGLRAISILWIMLTHVVWYRSPLMTPEAAASFLDSAPRWIMAGQFAVDVFFVISGFLIAFMLMREHRARDTIDVKRFYARRFLRLMPAYFVALAVYCLAVGVNCDMVWSNIVYVNNFVPIGRQAMPWAWSLAIEEQFYLVFPAFLLLVFYRIQGRRRRLRFLFLLLGIGVLIRAWAVHHWDIQLPISLAIGDETHRLVTWADQLYIKPHTRFGSLLCGVIAAALHLRGGLGRFFDRYRVLAGAALIGALVMAGFLVMAPVHVSTAQWSPRTSALFLVFDHYVFSAAVAYVLLYSLYPAGPVGRALSRLLSVRVLYPIAQLSYCTYLLHVIVIIRLYALAVSYGLLDLPLGVFYVVGPALSLLAGFGLYVLVERPFMSLRDVRVAYTARQEARTKA